MNSFESWMLAYLLNSLWQVPLVFAAAWLAVRFVRRSSSAIEHRIWVAAVALAAVLPACAFNPTELLLSFWRFVRIEGHGQLVGKVQVTVTPGIAVQHSALRVPAEVLAIVAIAYGCCIAYFAGRLALGLWKTAVLRRGADFVSLAGHAESSWERCSRFFGVDDAEAFVSADIHGPMTIGLRRKIILLPSDWQAALQGDDLAAAIAHEFAHMSRRDFAKNILYELLSLPVAYHPLLWLMRARLAESREMVCDAMAAEAVAGKEQYARSLLRLASSLSERTPARTLHAIGIFDANIFERRIMSLTEKSVASSTARRIATVAACVVLGLGACASALALRITLPAPAQSAIRPVAAVQSPASIQAFAPVQIAAVQAPAPVQRVAPVEASDLVPTAAVQASATVQEPAQSPVIVQDAGPVRVSAAVLDGQILTRVDPVYPPSARAAGVSGAVVLHAIIGADGTMQQLSVVSGPEMLKGAAIEAVRQWTYKPFLLNGDPVAVDTTITVTFSLEP
jgi:TonB family protein